MEESTIMYMDISSQGLSAAVNFTSKSSYIRVSFTVGSCLGTGPVINLISATVFFASSSVTANSSFSLLFPLSLSLMNFPLFKTKALQTSPCFLSASVYCIEVHHKKLLSGKSVSVHTAKRRTYFLFTSQEFHSQS